MAIDGSTREVHDRIRGAKALEKSLRVIENVQRVHSLPLAVLGVGFPSGLLGVGGCFIMVPV